MEVGDGNRSLRGRGARGGNWLDASGGHLRTICSMAFGGKRPLITIRLDASIEPVVPISAIMNAYTVRGERQCEIR